MKKNPEMSEIYVILLTARGQTFDRQNGLAVGADLFLTKPFRPREILTKSQEILGLN